MAHTKAETEQFCQKILKHRRIKGCIVVLCEGDPDYIEVHTPQQMRRLETLPDANFWRAAVPRSWRDKRPVFLPCGSRNAVLATYRKLKELHDSDQEDSYLAPEYLFVLIDTDIQPAELAGVSSNYLNTNELHRQMYADMCVNKEVICEEKVILTGWIHKESYFLEPDLQSQFDSSDYQLRFEDSELQLDNIYEKMADDLVSDEDINKHFASVCGRTEGYFSEQPANSSELAAKWKASFSGAHTNSTAKRKLIECMLSIRKAKPYWNTISVAHSFSQLHENALRIDLTLEIAQFYADQCQLAWNNNPPTYHIPQWIQILRDYFQANN